jgi:hypothetical protein
VVAPAQAGAQPGSPAQTNGGKQQAAGSRHSSAAA